MCISAVVDLCLPDADRRVRRKGRARRAKAQKGCCNKLFHDLSSRYGFTVIHHFLSGKTDLRSRCKIRGDVQKETNF